MNSVLTEAAFSLSTFIVTFLWNIGLSILEWLVPRSWYAKDVSKDIVLITGAGSGLGREISLNYARLGSRLVLWDVNQAGLDETKRLVDLEYIKLTQSSLNQKVKPTCAVYKVDVSDSEVVKKMAEQVHLDLNCGRQEDELELYVSVLINNAGIYHGLMLHELRDDQIKRIFSINILAHFWTVRAFLPQMIKHEKGHIVEIASMGGIGGLLKQVDYCATKFATVGFEESLSIELDHLGLADKIHTTVVCPFFFSSNLFTGFDSSMAQLMSSQFVARETVLAMRCNHSRILLPKLKSYWLYTIKTFLPRSAIIQLTRTIGLANSIKKIKGAAVQASADH